MKNIRNILVPAAVCLFAAFAGCGFGSGDPEFLITGTVTDALTGKPVAGAYVSDGTYGGKVPRGDFTDEDGTYSYSTWYEEHSVTVVAEGYAQVRETLVTKPFAREQSRRLDITLKK